MMASVKVRRFVVAFVIGWSFCWVAVAEAGSSRNQGMAKLTSSTNSLATGPVGPMCPMGCECDTPGVVSCINARLHRLPLRLPLNTKFFYAEHNRFVTPALNHRNFTSYVGTSGRSTLTGMSLHNCSITMIGFKTFTSLKSLQELDLSNNKISIIEDNTFNGLSLNMLDLSYNVGIQFSKQAFCGCTIRRLALRAVGLKNFDLTTFSFIFSNLMSLSLADNRLLSLDYRLFSCAPNLSTVYLARNPWWCGGDCSTLKLINHINRHAGDLVMDEMPTCQPGYDEQQDPDLNKADCAAKIAAINNSSKSLPECPVNIATSSQSSGRSLPGPSDAPQTSSSAAVKHEEELSSERGFVTWDIGVLANYTKSVTIAPTMNIGASKQDDDTVATVAAGGACFRLSTVVAASTMASVATLVIVLSMCLCIRACYMRCHTPDHLSNAQLNGFSTQTKSLKNGHGNGNGITTIQPPSLPHNNHHHHHHSNGTKNGASKTSNGTRGSLSSSGAAVVTSQGQPLLMHNSSSSDSSHHNGFTNRHSRGVLA